MWRLQLLNIAFIFLAACEINNYQCYDDSIGCILNTLVCNGENDCSNDYDESRCNCESVQ